jgi:methionine biosynthesis protein MetW
VANILTANDFERSQTSFNMADVTAALRDLIDTGHGRLLDVGCGFGGIAATLAREFELSDVYGLDLDPRVIAEAQEKGLHAIQHDLNEAPLPYPDDAFDIVTCFGVLDYFPYFDDPIVEVSRVLRAGGLVVVSLPNLASWHNRLSLLLGYQPRDVE